MHIRALLLLLMMLTACRPSASSSPSTSVLPELWAGLPHGVHEVGYRRLIDTSGVVDVWYPARSASRRLSTKDYLGADTTRLIGFLRGAQVSDSTVRGLLGERLFASFVPAPKLALFPLVLIAQGNGQDVFDQVVLAEFLASNGFIVASTPSPMLRTPMTSEAQTGALASRQSAQLSRAIAMVARVSRADTTNIGVVGHSFGARSALLLAMQDTRVKVLVSFDGGIGTATARAEFERAPGFSAEANLPHLLHFYETLDAFMKPDFSMISELHFASRTLSPVSAMYHTHFTTYGFAVGRYADLARLTRATDATTSNVVRMHAQTAQFLHRYLRSH